MKKKPRDNITKKDVMQLLDETDEKSMEMANYCEKHVLRDCCCDCPHFKPCQRVTDELMDRPVVQGNVIGAFFMSDLLYHMHRRSAFRRE